MILYLGTEHDAVPVIVENGHLADFTGAREATDAEYAAYLAYWNAVCSACGRERGNHAAACDPSTSNAPGEARHG